MDESIFELDLVRASGEFGFKCRVDGVRLIFLGEVLLSENEPVRCILPDVAAATVCAPA